MGHTQCQDSKQEGSKEMGYRDEKGAVRGQSRRELVSPPPPPASPPFHLYKHPLKLVLVLHPLWGEETKAQRLRDCPPPQSWLVQLPRQQWPC